MFDPKKRVCVIDKTESFKESLGKDIVTFSFLIFCIYISHESTWWTFITGLMFLMFAISKIYSVFKLRANQFDNKEDLKNWVEKLDW